MILLENPNLLLLDEPTNHLDMKTVEWLEEYLKNYKGMVLIVSHDRYFINKLCSKVVDLESEKFTNFPGNYEYYREKRDENKQVEEVKTKFKKGKPDKIQSEDKKREIKRIKLEESISISEEKLKILQDNMNGLGNDYEQLKKCLEEEAIIKRALEGLMEEWCK